MMMTPQEQTLLSRIRVWGGMQIAPADAETAKCLETKGYIVLSQSHGRLIALTAERAKQNTDGAQ